MNERLLKILRMCTDITIQVFHKKECDGTDLKIEFDRLCKKIGEDLDLLDKLVELVDCNSVGYSLRQVVEKGLYQIYLEQMCDIMCPEPENEEYEDFE